MVFHWSIYLLNLLFILSFALVSVAIIKTRTRKRRKISFWRWTKLFIGKFYTCTMAYLGQMWWESPMRLLQLVSLFGLTFSLWIYGSGFSTNSVSIKYPTTFETYKSLLSSDSLFLIIGNSTLSYFKNRKFTNSSVETYMQQALMQNYFSFILRCPKNLQMAAKGKLAYIFEEERHGTILCQHFQSCKQIYGKSFNISEDAKSYILRNFDPDAKEAKKQLLISKSTRRAKKVLFLMRRITESNLNNLFIDIRKDYQLLVKTLPEKSNCFVDSLQPHIENVINFPLTDMKYFLQVISFLLMLALISLVFEIFCTKRRRSKTFPLNQRQLK